MKNVAKHPCSAQTGWSNMDAYEPSINTIAAVASALVAHDAEISNAIGSTNVNSNPTTVPINSNVEC